MKLAFIDTARDFAVAKLLSPNDYHATYNGNNAKEFIGEYKGSAFTSEDIETARQIVADNCNKCWMLNYCTNEHTIDTFTATKHTQFKCDNLNDAMGIK
jgi:hypothetical protein